MRELTCPRSAQPTDDQAPIDEVISNWGEWNLRGVHFLYIELYATGARNNICCLLRQPTSVNVLGVSASRLGIVTRIKSGTSCT